MKYHEISYPKFLWFDSVRNIWKRVFCSRGWHLFDEVGSGDEHYLWCDACKLLVKIFSISTVYMEIK